MNTINMSTKLQADYAELEDNYLDNIPAAKEEDFEFIKTSLQVELVGLQIAAQAITHMERASNEMRNTFVVRNEFNPLLKDTRQMQMRLGFFQNNDDSYEIRNTFVRNEFNPLLEDTRQMQMRLGFFQNNDDS